MKANVGMIYPVASAVATYTPFSGITYGTGFVVSEARGADINWETEDGEFRGDDIVLDTSKGILGYTIAFESSGLADTVKAKLLGDVKDSTTDEYTITGKQAPDVGFGYVRRMRDNSSGTVVENFEAWWFYKVKFAQPNEQARTKEKTVEWRVPTINGTGMGVYLTSGAEDPDFATHQTFTTLAAAKAYLNTKAGISTQSATT